MNQERREEGIRKRGKALFWGRAKVPRNFTRLHPQHLPLLHLARRGVFGGGGGGSGERCSCV